MGLAQWYDEQVVPRFIRCACSSPVIMHLREKVVPLAGGRVFEIGCGGGINQPYYDPARISGYAGLDPSPKGLEFARAAAEAKGWQADLRQGSGEAIPFGDASFDCVVCTFTLCSVESQAQTLSELRRILRPGGRLLYAEHGCAPDPGVQRWQNRVDPLWSRLAGGCHLNRPIAGPMRAAGFVPEPLGQGYAPKTPRWVGWMEWGVATAPA